MKTSIKLILIYFVLQILGSLTVAPFALLFTFLETGKISNELISTTSMPYALLMGMVYMVFYLWKAGYLKKQYHLFKRLNGNIWSLGIISGLSVMLSVQYLVSFLAPYLPNYLEATFNNISNNIFGLVTITLIGPIMEELLFRGSITRVLSLQYKPVMTIIISGLIFGFIHINPIQVVPACFIGFFLAWLFLSTKSLWLCIILHVINNSISAYSILNHSNEDEVLFFIPEPYRAITYGVIIILAVIFTWLLAKELKKEKIQNNIAMKN